MLLFALPTTLVWLPITFCDNAVTSRLQSAQFLPSICPLMIISTLRVGPEGSALFVLGGPLSTSKRL